ncbi:FAD-dependent oxidoreductase, partial [Vibrio cholerae]
QIIYNEKIRKKVQRIIDNSIPFTQIACYLDEDEVNNISGLDVNYDALFYPQAGWLSPTELTINTLKYAEQLGLTLRFNHQVTQISAQEASWHLKVVHHDGKSTTQFQ